MSEYARDYNSTLGKKDLLPEERFYLGNKSYLFYFPTEIYFQLFLATENHQQQEALDVTILSRMGIPVSPSNLIGESCIQWIMDIKCTYYKYIGRKAMYIAQSGAYDIVYLETIILSTKSCRVYTT